VSISQSLKDANHLLELTRLAVISLVPLLQVIYLYEEQISIYHPKSKALASGYAWEGSKTEKAFYSRCLLN